MKRNRQINEREWNTEKYIHEKMENFLYVNMDFQNTWEDSHYLTNNGPNV